MIKNGSQKYQSIETKNYAKNQKDRHQSFTNDFFYILENNSACPRNATLPTLSIYFTMQNER